MKKLIASLALMASATVVAQEYIVNIDAKENGFYNPLFVHLPPGKYRVTHIKDEYVAANNWGGATNNCTNYGWCSQGWERSYYINGYDYNVTPTIDSGEFGYTLNCETNVGQWESAEIALMYQRGMGVTCDFTMPDDGYLTIFKPDPDHDYSNNLGGVSLQIQFVEPICKEYNNGWGNAGDSNCAPGASADRNNAANGNRSK